MLSDRYKATYVPSSDLWMGIVLHAMLLIGNKENPLDPSE
jgi:hypothetical protein